MYFYTLMLHENEIPYHQRQFEKTYRSTEMFIDWLKEVAPLHEARRVVDVATGAGSTIAYCAARFPKIEWTGIDNDSSLIEMGTKLMQGRHLQNAHLLEGDLYHLSPEQYSPVDGIISIQVLSWLPHYDEALRALFKLNPRWIAATSIFYEGNIDTFINVRDYYRPKDGQDYAMYYYNIYSLERLQAFLAKHGYTKFIYQPFVIDIDLKKQGSDIGTYTRRLEDGRRLQFSGALWLPWYFIYAAKE